MVSWTLTAAGFLVTTSVFFLTLYLAGFKKLVSSRILLPYILVILVAAVIPLILSIVTTLMVLVSDLSPSDKWLVAFYSAAPIVPSAVILAVISWKRP